ncbi:MAG: cyclodeaminase/cyclohydrolase family protein [Actinobacteria bacterium]|nr:cyclodeaminase/cyclohydrolase family protein [Actinomycetota bacterium]
MSDHEPVVYCRAPLQTYLDDVASGKPAPGGGSVSACVGALGAALLSMFGNLTVGKEKFAAVDGQMRGVLASVGDLRSRLEKLLQDDTVAYNGVITAYGLPQDTQEQRAARKRAVQQGLIAAADVPLSICRVAVEVCRLARSAVEIGNPAVVTDAGISAILGEAAVQGGALNVRINLGSIEDCDYVERTEAELEILLAEAAALRAEVLRVTNQRL